MTVAFQYNDGGRKQDGFTYEHLDCTVRAFALARDISYAESHKLFMKAGRKSCHTTKFYKFMQKSYPNISHTETIKPRPRVKTFLKQNKYHNIILRISGHIFCVKDNVILDIIDAYQRCIVTDIWVFDND